MKTKYCGGCFSVKDIAEFSKKKSNKDGLQRECKVCRNIYNKKWRKDNDKTRREHQLLHKFDITIEEYNKMFIHQHGVCDICGKPETSRTKKGKLKWLSVDHNHDTGEVRGLLCGRCNAAIGLLMDNVNILNNAIEYLNKRGSYGKE